MVRHCRHTAKCKYSRSDPIAPFAATAIIDRFLHRAEVIQITGRSFRLKDAALQRTKANASTAPDSEPTPSSNSSQKAGKKELVFRFPTGFCGINPAQKLSPKSRTRIAPQSPDAPVLRLHSCRALSPGPQPHPIRPTSSHQSLR